MSLFERSLAITHDMDLVSIAFPLIGSGLNEYPAVEVIKAILDACSLFRQPNSPLKKVVIVIWSGDDKNQKVGNEILFVLPHAFHLCYFQDLHKDYSSDHILVPSMFNT